MSKYGRYVVKDGKVVQVSTQKKYDPPKPKLSDEVELAISVNTMLEVIDEMERKAQDAPKPKLHTGVYL